MDELIDVLHLSVRAERFLKKAGVTTVWQLRTLSPDFVGCGLSKGNRQVTVKALAAYDVERKAERESLVKVATEAMRALTDAERARVHDATGCCICASTVKTLVEHPAASAGALAGAILGVLLAPRPAKAVVK